VTPTSAESFFGSPTPLSQRDRELRGRPVGVRVRVKVKLRVRERVRIRVERLIIIRLMIIQSGIKSTAMMAMMNRLMILGKRLGLRLGLEIIMKSGII
jgi:hypothetical protein